MCGELQDTEEARGITRREQLFQIGPFAAGPTELVRRGQLEIELPVLGAGAAVAATVRSAEVRYSTAVDIAHFFVIWRRSCLRSR
jgi:hypothetical protein